MHALQHHVPPVENALAQGLILLLLLLLSKLIEHKFLILFRLLSHSDQKAPKSFIFFKMVKVEVMVLFFDRQFLFIGLVVVVCDVYVVELKLYLLGLAAH